MAIVQSDWTIDRATGDIRYVGGDHDGTGGSPSYATVIEFHRFLQDLADDAVSFGDDQLDITDEDPSARSTDNIITLLGNYQIDNTAAEHLYDGSIIQNGGDDIYDGIVNFGNLDVQIQLIQNGAVISDDWWNFNGGGLNASAAAGISHRFMVKTRTAGSDIDGRRLIGTTRQFNKTYSEFSINGTSRGNNVLALSNSDDLNNQTDILTIASYTGITNTFEGYNGIDVDNNGSVEYYYSKWDVNKPTNTINDFYEYAKYLTTDLSNTGATSQTLYGLNGELFRGITHQIPVSGASGTYVQPELISWSTGTGQLLAIDSTTAPNTMWIQLLTGTAPSSVGIVMSGAGGATSEVDGSVISRSISSPFAGQSTGSAIIGSYGLGIETDDLTNSDTLFDLTNTSINPPNNVTFTVGGLASGQDRVLVAPWDGVSLDNENNPAIYQAQLVLQETLSASTAPSYATPNSVVISGGTPIPSDTPSSGTIRVVDDAGFDRRLEYSAYTGNIFEGITDVENGGTQTNFSGTTGNFNRRATSGNDVYITYIDTLADASTEAFTAVYDSDRSLVVVVRDGGGTPIKQFITSATFSSSDTTVTAIRTSDT
jgi:hypothetical protein